MGPRLAATPEEGRALAIAIHSIQPDLDILKAGQRNPDSSIDSGQVVAIEFHIIAGGSDCR